MTKYLKAVVSLAMLVVTIATVLKAAHLAYIAYSAGMFAEFAMGLLVASLAIGFTLLMFVAINHLHKPKKKRSNG